MIPFGLSGGVQLSTIYVEPPNMLLGGPRLDGPKHTEEETKIRTFALIEFWIKECIRVIL